MNPKYKIGDVVTFQKGNKTTTIKIEKVETGRYANDWKSFYHNYNGEYLEKYAIGSEFQDPYYGYDNVIWGKRNKSQQ